jgi:2-polyprenyl-3-methyl-5-hydroxy-6-metoxy-1,4-benzoquinol methylase
MAYENFAYVYDTLMGDIDYCKWVEFLNKIIAKNKIQVKNVLELGCGTGNMTTRLSRLGLDITGIDISPEMLSIAKQKALENNQDIMFLNQDITKLNIGKMKYDCIIGFMDVINYIHQPKTLQKVFKNIYNHLSDSGIFVFDIRTPYVFNNLMNSSFAENTQNVSYICENVFNARTNICNMIVTFFILQSDNNIYRKVVEQHKLRSYGIDKILNLLESAGFKRAAVYNNLSFKRPSETSERYFFAVSKF